MITTTMARAGVPAPASKKPGVIVALLIAVAAPLLGLASPAPDPSASPAVPEIGRVRSKALCTALRSNIAPAVVGLMKNDDLIGAGHRGFAKMSFDAAGTSSAAMDIDKLYLGQVETRLVHNLKVIDELLSDKTRFPANPKTDDDKSLAALHDNLTAVAAAQRKALDLVAGTLDTEALGQMQSEISSDMKSASGPTQPYTAPTAAPVSFIGSAGLPEYEPVAGIPTTAQKTSTLHGHTVYDAINSALEASQFTIAQRERAATSAVVAAADSCKAAAPSPAPSP